MIKFDGTMICASKYFNVDEILKIKALGINHFGENQVNALIEKKSLINDEDITWHMIGKLQTNKIKKIINEIDYLHSLESIKQAELIQKYRNQPLKCFIQLNISGEETKSGISINKLNDFINDLVKYDKIEIIGFMTMGVDNDLTKTNLVFDKANQLKKQYNYSYLSMGMTSDYELAIANEATHIRIGSYFKTLI